MADDGLRARAAAYVDAQFKQTRDGNLREHGRQERRLLAYHQAELQKWKNNRDIAEIRHAQRIKTIDARQQRAAIVMETRHNSIGGRLTALTRGGRAKQAQEREALAERGDTLRMQAHRNLEALKGRQFQGEQADRVARAREIKLFRQDFADMRQQQAKMHNQTRDHKIDLRVQSMKDGIEQDRQLKLERDKKRTQTPTQEFAKAGRATPTQTFRQAARAGAKQEGHQQQQPKQNHAPKAKQDFDQARRATPKQEFGRAGRGRSM